MPEITVTKPFRLMQKDGTPKDFCVGVHTVTCDEAEHWYVQAHADVDVEALNAEKAGAALKAAEAAQAASEADVATAAAAASVATAAVAAKKAK